MSVRSRLLGLLALSLALALASFPVCAQLTGSDTAPGSSCAGYPAGATRLTADADQDGAQVVLICDGTIWNAMAGAGGGGGGDYQAFTASGTWTKPSGLDANQLVIVDMWGGGGGGNSNGNSGGGGGGAYNRLVLKAGSLGATVAVTVGAGGAIQTAGGNSSFGSFGNAYGGGRSSGSGGGGGGGGGLNGSGSNNSSGTGGDGGGPQGGAGSASSGTPAGESIYGGGGGAYTGGGSSGVAGASVYGGGGGGGYGAGSGNGTNGGASVYGGGGGGGSSGGVGGTSVYGGAGGAAGVAGSIPAGGGGRNAAGARGEVRAWVVPAGGSGGGSADNLGDHTATQDLDLATNDLLNVGAIGAGLNALSDVDTTGAAADNVLLFSGGLWIPGTVSGGGGGAAPAFSVHKNGTNQTVTADVMTKLTWGTELFDNNNNFASDRFTPTVAGKYMFVVGASAGGGSVYTFVALHKNGAVVATVGDTAAGTGGSKLESLTYIVEMNGSSDYVEAFAQTSDTSISGNATQTYFMGSLIGGGGGSADNLGDHTATQDLDLATNDLLNVGSIDALLDSLSDVDTTGVGVGDVLLYSGGNWVPGSVSGGGGSFHGFMAHRNGATWNTGSLAKVNWTTETYDTDSEFNLTTDRFQPAEPGYYYLQASGYVVDCDAQGESSVQLLKNGAELATRSFRSEGAMEGHGLTVSIVVYLNGTSDYVEAWSGNGTCGNFSGEPRNGFFFGYALEGGGAGESLWFASGSSIHYSSGTVGIGTDSPNSKLVVTFDPDVSGFENTAITADAPGSTDDDFAMILRQSTGPGQAEPIMVVNGLGNVGIGTADPKTALDINGAIRIGTMATCDADREGTIRYVSASDPPWEYCDGLAWSPFRQPRCGDDDTGECFLQATRSNDDPEFIADNIADGVTILGVTGTLDGGGVPCTDDYTGTCTLDAIRTDGEPDLVASSVFCGVNVLGVVGNYGGDITPNGFSFTDQTMVATSTLMESEIVQISGTTTNCQVSISVSGAGGAQFRVCSDATCSTGNVVVDWTGTAGTIISGHYVQLRMTSNAANATMNSATLNVGAGNDQWDVTTIGDGPPGCTEVADTCPDGSIYVGQTNLFVAAADQSTGIAWSTESVVTGATSTTNGQSNQALIVSTMTLSNYPAFQLCENLDLYGHQDWLLPALNEVDLLFANKAAIGGFTTGQYWSSTEVTNVNAKRVSFLLGTNSNNAKTTATNRVRCVRRGAVFTFTDLVDVTASTLAESDIAQVSGIAAGASVSISGDGSPEYRVCSDAACNTVLANWTSGAGTMNNNQYLQLRLTSNATAGATNTATATVGGTGKLWNVTTFLTDSTPDSFGFVDRIYVAPSSLTTSTIVQITGINVSVSVSISGAGSPEYRVCSDATCNTVVTGWTSGADTIDNNQYLQLRLTSNAADDAMNSATVTVSAANDQWDVTTVKPGSLYHWGGSSASTPVQRNGTTGWAVVSAGARHSCAINTGALYCWGYNTAGATGLGTTSGTTANPTQVGSDTDWTAVSAGRNSSSFPYTCGIRSGMLYCWGDNSTGKTGLGLTSGNNTTPVQVGSAVGWTMVGTAGYSGSTPTGHSCGIRSGKLYCWGTNDSGRTGLGTSSGNQTTPAQVGTLSDWSVVAVAEMGGCGIRSGRLYCWGENTAGATGLGTTSGIQTTPAQVGSDTGWTAVALGGRFNTDTTEDEYFTCGIDAGALYCWGSNYNGKTGLGTTSGDQTTPAQVGSDTDWVDVSAGEDYNGDFACGVRSNGNVYCWGSNYDYQTGLGTSAGEQLTPGLVGTGGWENVSAAGDGQNALAILNP